MADEDTGGEGAEEKGTDTFDPKTLSPEAQEYIRRSVQAESDSKSALVEKRLRDEQARSARSAVESAEEKELASLAESGQHEALGQRVAARLAHRSVEERAIANASDVIERQIADKFSPTLGPGRVEEIRQEVIKEEGAHAEFAEALAKATGDKTKSEEIAAEVKAQLIEAGVAKRDETPGADKATGAGQGTKLSAFDEVEQAYIDGTLTGGRKAYEAAMEARDKGR